MNTDPRRDRHDTRRHSPLAFARVDEVVVKDSVAFNAANAEDGRPARCLDFPAIFTGRFGRPDITDSPMRPLATVSKQLPGSRR
jgi:hypothetical protein